MRYLVVVAALLGSVLLPSQRAYACSVGPAPTVDMAAQEAVIIASGTLVNGTDDVIMLQVEEYFKGDVRFPEISLNNHQFANDESCAPIIGDGSWLPEGVRVLAFLRVDEFGLADLRPAGVVRQYIFKIPDDPTHQMVFVDGEQPFVTLDEARVTLAELYGPAAAPDGTRTSGSSGSGGGTGGNGGRDVVEDPVIEPGGKPLPPDVVIDGPAIMPMPPVKEPPRPITLPEAEPAAETSAAGSGAPLLPRLLLGVLVTITLLLALWTAVTTLRRRADGET